MHFLQECPDFSLGHAFSCFIEHFSKEPLVYRLVSCIPQVTKSITSRVGVPVHRVVSDANFA